MSENVKTATIVVLVVLLLVTWGVQILNQQARQREERAAYTACLQGAQTQGDLLACDLAFPRQSR